MTASALTTNTKAQRVGNAEGILKHILGRLLKYPHVRELRLLVDTRDTLLVPIPTTPHTIAPLGLVRRAGLLHGNCAVACSHNMAIGNIEHLDHYLTLN